MGQNGGDLFSPADPSDGSSSIIRATATTSWTAYPSVAGANIYKFIVDNDIDNSGSRRVWVAYSSGASNYVSLAPGDSFEEFPKNTTQIWIRTASSTATISLSFAFEE